jgi:PAS domain S-box-containing protein
MDQTLPDLSQTSQQDLRVLLDNAPDAIARFDRQLRHVYVNEATARENGRPASDFYYRTMEDLGHTPEVCALINDNLEEVFRTARERTLEILFEGPFGKRWFQCRMAPEFSDGNVEFVLVVSRDISEQRQAQASLMQADKRSQAVALTERLAHEINNPLAILVNTVYLLERNESLDDPARELVRLAREAADRLSGISRQILHIYGEGEIESRD